MTKVIAKAATHEVHAQKVDYSRRSPSSLKVVQVCTSAERGGAGKATYRLHRALADTGVSSQLFVAQRFGGNIDSIEYNPLSPAPAFLGKLFFRMVRRWHRPSFRRAGAYVTFDRTPIGRRLPSVLPRCDVVNLHWVADLLDYRTLPKIISRTPLIWTFHDMNSFTGGCHYSETCERYTLRCGACPQLKTSSGENDETRQAMNRKLSVALQLDAKRFSIVCPSRWLAREVARSSMFRNFNVHVIPNGVDLTEFHPIDRTTARRHLNLPTSAKVVLFVADNLADRRKGFAYLLSALDELRNIPDLLLVTLGRGDTYQLDGSSFRHLGELHDVEKLRYAYSAADVFAISSLQDNLPNTILEAMACGTPVAGFDVGGIGEAVINGKNGFLAAKEDTAGLARALERILVDGTLRQSLAEEALRRIQFEYNAKLQAERYADLYASMANLSR